MNPPELHQHLQHYWTQLKWIFVSNINIIRNSAVMPDFCSDHCYLILEIKFRSLRENSYTKTILDYNNADYEYIKTHLDLIKWHERLDNLNDTNVINNFINDDISFCINSFISQKIIRVRPKEKPWMHSNVRRRMRQRNRASKKAKQKNTPDYWKKV